jgi:hypothetical protein
MKKLTLLFAFIFSAMLMSAQNGAVPAGAMTAEVRANRLTEKIAMVAKDLTPAQKSQIGVYTLERTKALDKNKQTGKPGEAAFEAERKRIINKWIADVQTILSEEQKKVLMAYREEELKKNPNGDF